MNDFAKLCLDFEVSLDDEQVKKFDIFYELLVEANKNFNLTAITSKNEVFVKHFLDSLTLCKYLPKNAKICDVGAGAGFPSIPLLIARRDLKITMIDSLAKRVNFLGQVLRELGLEAECYHTRVEDFARTNSRESFDCVVARAVASLATLSEYCLPLVKIGGQFIAMKSKCDEELSQGMVAVNILGGKFKEKISFLLCDEFERSLVIVEKTNKTANKYPRGKNKERLMPLGS